MPKALSWFPEKCAAARPWRRRGAPAVPNDGTGAQVKSEIRRPKSEGNPKEIRNPKSETRSARAVGSPRVAAQGLPLAPAPRLLQHWRNVLTRCWDFLCFFYVRRPCDLGLRISDFGFPSDFGIRVSGFRNAALGLGASRSIRGWATGRPDNSARVWQSAPRRREPGCSRQHW